MKCPGSVKCQNQSDTLESQLTVLDDLPKDEVYSVLGDLYTRLDPNPSTS